MNIISEKERAALERLIGHAKRDSGQSRRAADFLLAWWNTVSCGGFDIATAWGCDDDIVEDMITVFALAARSSAYPDKFGYEKDFNSIVREWRPELTE